MSEKLFIIPSLLKGVGPINAAAKKMAEQMRTNDPDEVWRRINSGEWIVSAATKPIARFNPAEFIGKSWSFAEARDPRSAALGLLDDYSKVVLSTSWLEGQASVDGETRRIRILADTAHGALNADHFLDLWNNKDKIPEAWKKVVLVTFDGDVLRSPFGSRLVPFLYWFDGEWHWFGHWLGSDWLGNVPAAVLAS